ncbi:L7Ae/L30e/S12e/Gadd45 family ribosomal protein [Hominifimenecus sp. rT4P-3]|uniref:L7Ae/L30e/S12e/Gadd45 family ribosomal protein n=1 Tax=Hominifimenecus sp. rT4P-3 TaxID=3242979 RepID=UPI003DA4081D
MQQNKAMSYLGLAARARHVESGEFCTERAVKRGNAKLVLVASDASENTKKAVRDMCTYYHTEWLVFGEKESLGHAIGKSARACLALMDQGLADAVKEQLIDRNQDGGSEHGK